MPKYLSKVTFTAEAVQFLRQGKASVRQAETRKIFESIGGKLDGYYYVFGQDDVLVIGEFPDNVTAAAVSLLVNSLGPVRVTTTALITVEEMDQAIEKSASLKPPAR